MNQLSIWISVLALFLSVVAIGVSIWTHRKTTIHASHLHEDSKRNQRISAVVEKYYELQTESRSSDLPGLVRAGIGGLSNAREMEEAIQKIANLQGGRDPLLYRKGDIMQIGLVRFFQTITRKECQSGRLLDAVIDRLLNTRGEENK